MSRPGPRPRLAPLTSVVVLALSGCGDVAVNSVSINPTPASVLEPQAPPDPRPAPEKKAAPNPKEAPAPAPKKESAAPAPRTTALAAILAIAPAPGPAAAGDVRLEAIKFADLNRRIAANKGAKLTMVDVWSTTCGPCMENFPHLVAMHARFARRGLAVTSLAMDPPDDEKAVRRAEEFLREQKATFTNFRLDEDPDVAYEQLDFVSLPAVFLYGPGGKLVKRFTMDDPNHQFTYDEVEKAIEALLSPAAGRE